MNRYIEPCKLLSMPTFFSFSALSCSAIGRSVSAGGGRSMFLFWICASSLAGGTSFLLGAMFAIGALFLFRIFASSIARGASFLFGTKFASSTGRRGSFIFGTTFASSTGRGRTFIFGTIFASAIGRGGSFIFGKAFASSIGRGGSFTFGTTFASSIGRGGSFLLGIAALCTRDGYSNTHKIQNRSIMKYVHFVANIAKLAGADVLWRFLGRVTSSYLVTSCVDDGC